MSLVHGWFWSLASAIDWRTWFSLVVNACTWWFSNRKNRCLLHACTCCWGDDADACMPYSSGLFNVVNVSKDWHFSPSWTSGIVYNFVIIGTGPSILQFTSLSSHRIKYKCLSMVWMDAMKHRFTFLTAWSMSICIVRKNEFKVDLVWFPFLDSKT